MISFIDVDIELQNRPILKNLNFSIQPGELVYLVGKSGTGKTTLFRSLYMDVKPKKGEIHIAGYSSRTIRKREIPMLRRKLGIVFQDFRLMEDRNVYENLAFVLMVTGTAENLIEGKVRHALSSVGLEHAAGQMPRCLSGGEQQRVSIARAIVREPVIVIADEPTGNLDPDTSIEILEYLKRINRQGITVLIGTHDYELVRHSPSRTLRISNFTVAETTMEPSATGFRPAAQS